MKHIRAQAKAAEAAKLARHSNMNSGTATTAAGGTTGLTGFASGGSVSDMDVGGAPAKPSLAKSSRVKGGGKAAHGKKTGGTNVNVIIVPKGDKAGPADGAMAGPPLPPMAGPAGLPAGASPAPMPLPPHKDGGSVRKFAKGGRVDFDGGAGGGVGRLEKIRQYGRSGGRGR